MSAQLMMLNLMIDDAHHVIWEEPKIISHEIRQCICLSWFCFLGHWPLVATLHTLTTYKELLVRNAYLLSLTLKRRTDVTGLQ